MIFYRLRCFGVSFLLDARLLKNTTPPGSRFNHFSAVIVKYASLGSELVGFDFGCHRCCSCSCCFGFGSKFGFSGLRFLYLVRFGLRLTTLNTTLRPRVKVYNLFLFG